jgi:glutamyl-tRNA synthetase
MNVRTRIAPSPTGDPHVGTAYIALFNLCFARQHGGTFVLRIEDTDQARSTAESETAILESLRWLGLEWDEGPDVGGPHAPYRQSERGAIYQRHADMLLESGNAFRCFCTTARLDALRREQQAAQQTPGYDGHCLALGETEVAQRLAAGEAHVVRMKVPREGTCTVQDMLRGEISIEWSQVDMQVLLKADGMPTYHLANVVDDHLMEITHVLRGEEWINSAPKHMLLYRYFGWQMPVLCHMPLLRNPDKSKLSKRKNPTSILYYRRMGYLPEALLNYLGRMGWSMPDEREKFTLAEMLTDFAIERVSLGGPVFDLEKLNWLNALWIRESLSLEALADRLQEWALNRDNLLRILPHLQPRMERLSDFAPAAAFLASGMLPLTEAHFSTWTDRDALLRQLQFTQWRLEGVAPWERDRVFAAMKALAEEMNLKIRDFLAPLFIAIAGSSATISVIDSMHMLGSDLSRARVRHALEALGGVSKKRLKELEKAYALLGAAAADTAEE